MNRAHRELELPGVRLRYRDDGVGRALVFIHGWTLDLDMWEPQVPLAAELRMVRYDRRGFGRSTGLPSTAADVDDLRALLYSLGIVSPLLVGMSQGARVALEFAARHPDVPCGLVLDGPPPLTGSDLPMEEFRQLALRDGLEAFRRAWSTHPLTQLFTGDARAHATLARILARYPGRDLVDGPATGHAPERETLSTLDLARIHAPALIVNGARDTEARRNAGRALHAALPSADHVIIQQAAHLPNLDAPQAYNQLMSDFARRHLTAAA